MPKQAYSLQISFHYNNGEKESFLITETADENDPYPELRQRIQELISQKWCPLHTAEETIYINMTNVDTISVKPALGESDEELSFKEAQRITALTRSSKVL
ncbi:hypothetical protein [Dactylococcopsis salina]|uniref:Uncharacterized protein n=1 Tax=Dactylococcopsis salina (strain PCC 8305) TaxID=13035 RepID=K9YU96_DACS8|nr:hypothetical protein [Dactylococcopsis salina]AFZ50469.1 hypothetical protein Dacsa_1812 [Dactylococcopsis salina PCC 8305]